MADGLKIFISHRSDDRELAEAIVRLLQNALNLKDTDIRCTSVDGYKLKGGADISTTLKQEVISSESFIAIISHTSIKSMYVAFEMGARWGTGKTFIPILAPSVSSSVLAAPLNEKNALSCDRENDLRDLVEDIAHELNLKPNRSSSYESYISAITNLPASLANNENNIINNPISETDNTRTIQNFIDASKKLKLQWESERRSNIPKGDIAIRILNQTKSMLTEYYIPFEKLVTKEDLDSISEAITNITNSIDNFSRGRRSSCYDPEPFWQFGFEMLSQCINFGERLLSEGKA